MRKLIIAVLFLATSSLSAQQSELNIGVNGGFTIGSLEQYSSSALGGCINFLVEISENVKAGPMVAGLFFPSKTINGFKPEDKIYLPIGVAARAQIINDQFFVGLDGGYAIPLSPEGDNGGIYVKPMIGYNIKDNFRVNLFYSGVKKRKPIWGYIGLGLSYNILGSGSYGLY